MSHNILTQWRAQGVSNPGFRRDRAFSSFQCTLTISHYFSVGDIAAAARFRGKLAHISVNFRMCPETIIQWFFGAPRKKEASAR